MNGYVHEDLLLARRRAQLHTVRRARQLCEGAGSVVGVEPWNEGLSPLLHTPTPGLWTPPSAVKNLESDEPRPMEGFAFALGAAAFFGLVAGVVIGFMVGRAW